MENEPWKTQNEERDSMREGLSVIDYARLVEKICPVCGNTGERGRCTKFCSVCGKSLSADYEPLDAFRAAYRLQGKSLGAVNAQTGEVTNLFERNKNSASESAKALVVYSLVPYLGILFCPFAFLTGGFGVFVAYRQPHLGGGPASIYSIGLGFVIFAVQIFLWWLLYIVPESGKSI